jgi:hypothetical protein
MPETFINPLRSAVKNGKVSMEVLNQRVREVLYVKFWLGMLRMLFFSFDGKEVGEYG